MTFVRRKRGHVVLVVRERPPGATRGREREIHRFESIAEVEEVLPDAAWTTWTRAVARREPDLTFDWPAIHERLRGEVAAANLVPRGTPEERLHEIELRIVQLAAALMTLSPAKAGDAAILRELRPSLVPLLELAATLVHEEDDEPPPGDEASAFQLADQIFEEGMEFWWEEDRKRAATYFRRALEIDPHHADAHNHLGIALLEARKAKDAERHFRAAVEGGERHVELHDGQAPWGVLENRPFLRALGNLALCLAEQRKWSEAIAIHRRMLELNPNDNQGVRYLIGVEYLQAGDDESAIAAFERCAREEVGCAFGLALARLRAQGPSADVGEALLLGFAENRYVAPMLLGEPWTLLDAFHGTNMSEPEWVADVVQAQGALWRKVAGGAEAIRFWWNAPAVVSWRKQLDAKMVALGTLPVGAALTEEAALRSPKSVRDLARAVLSAS